MTAVAAPPAAVHTASVSTVAPASNDVKSETSGPAPAEDKPAAEESTAKVSKDAKDEDDEKKSEKTDGKKAEAKSPAAGGAPGDTATRFDLEPNPFEQSFSRGSQPSDRTTPPRGGDATSIKHNALPPLSSLTSPAAADPTQFPWLAGQSLRSGPLSPAMLAGPAQNNQSNSSNNNANANTANNNSNSNPTWGPSTENGATEENFEPGNFRTGFTPGTGSGFTPGYNALLNSNFGTLPMPSPNTAAFLNSITNVNNENSENPPVAGAENRPPPSSVPPHLQQPHGMSHLNPAHSASETITPNTLNALAGVGNDLNRQPGMQPAFYPGGPGMPPQGGMPPGMPPVDYAQQNANAASQAANGLFLLTQAHQELSKREEEARSGSTPPGKRGSIGNGPQSKNTGGGQKRKEAPAKGGNSKRSKKTPEVEEDDDDSDKESKKSSGEKRGRPETEEEKRKNFLERNRQAALKCRQRKKAWLNELQTKVETLSTENERLQHNVRGLEDEVARLTSILMQHRDCGLAMPPMPPAYGRPLR